MCAAAIPPEHMFFVEQRHGVSQAVCVPCVNARRHYRTPWASSGQPRWRYVHDCLRCGRRFYGAIARVYCSDACGEATRAARRSWPTVNRTRPCAVCGAMFTPPRSDGRYCSAACRQKAYRRRAAGHPAEVDR